MLGLSSLLLLACGDRALGDMELGGSSTGDASSEDTDAEPSDTDTDADDDADASSSDDSGSAELEEPRPACDCVEFDLVCGADADLATVGCDLPTPCGLLDDEGVDPEPVECILQLLIEQEPARFQYHFRQPGVSWEGWFYILGPGVGLDNECTTYGGGSSPETIPQANDYELAEPVAFEECLGGSPNEMRSCLLAGLDKSHSVPQCQ